MKPDSVKIISISVRSAENEQDLVYGLGDDGKIYWWNISRMEWEMHHRCQWEKREEREPCKICGWKYIND